MVGSLWSLVAILDLVDLLAAAEEFPFLVEVVLLEMVLNLLDPVQVGNLGGSQGAGVQIQCCCCAFLHSQFRLGGIGHVWKEPHSDWEVQIGVSLVLLLLLLWL